MVNGVKQTVPEGTTVTQLLDTLKILPERVVVEVNLTILKRAEHARTTLKEGDQVEIVHFVGGGSSDKRPETRDRRPQASWSLVSCLTSQVS